MNWCEGKGLLRRQQTGASLGEGAESHMAPRQGLAGALSDLSVGRRSPVTLQLAALRGPLDSALLNVTSLYPELTASIQTQLVLRTCTSMLISS